MKDTNLKYLHGLVKLEGIGPKRIDKLLAVLGTPKEIWEASAEKLKQVEGIGGNLAAKMRASIEQANLDTAWEQTKNFGIQLLDRSNGFYPGSLNEIHTPPVLLFCKGDLDLLKSPMLGIVGTRSPTRYGYEVLNRIIPELCEAGIVIVSGFARGIDGIAHDICLKNRGKTIAVLGGGIDRIYPPEHNELYKKIIAEGLLISEYPLGKAPQPGNFPARNRIISGLSKAVLVVEAPGKSGAMITAELALEQNKDVMVIPGNITSPKSKGCNELMREGAKPVLEAADILEEFEGLISDLETRNSDKWQVGELFEKDSRLLSMVPPYPYKLHLEELLTESKLKHEVFIQEILELELNGYIVKQAGGFVSRIK